MRKSRFVFLFVAVSPLLFWSCATSNAPQQTIGPIATLSYSSEGTKPAAFAVIPPSFVLSTLEDLENEALADASFAADFLNEFFARADCVFASIMCNSDTGALFCRILALGKFPSRAKMLLSSSRGWQKKEAGGETWFESTAFTEGRALRAAIPASGVLLAEIDIVSPPNGTEMTAASRSMADFIVAATSTLAEPQDSSQAREAGAGAMFFSSLDAALLGADNVPFAFYAPDFNLFLRSVLPAVPGFPLAGSVSALSALDGLSLPISSIEFAVDQVAGDDGFLDRLTVRVDVPSAALTRAAAVIVRLMFPDDDVDAEDGAITVTKEMPAGRAALAVLSFFLVS